jgi:hypothetical protein
MKTCHHSHWFGLSSENNEILLNTTSRAQTLLSELPYSESQRPSLFLLVGNKVKAIALKELASSTGKVTAARRGCGEIHLHVHPSTVFSDRPLLFGDGDFPAHPRPIKDAAASGCHEVTKRALPGPRSGITSVDLQSAADRLHSALLLPFTDVFCFFAADMGGLEPVAHRIAAWLETGRPATLPPASLPEIVVVTESSASESESRTLDRLLEMVARETRMAISACFAGVRVLNLLPVNQVSTQARHRRLKESLMAASDRVRTVRAESLTLFSAQHFAAFLDAACSHFVEGHSTPFDFIKTARLGNPPGADLSSHLKKFLGTIETLDDMRGFGVPFLASSLLLDHHPPEMHREWSLIKSLGG